jgi:DNA-binding NtrC family response regulator
MKRFIAKSNISKQIIKSAQLCKDLPINTIIYGEVGVGKKLLANEILPNSTVIFAKELEQSINTNKFNIQQYNSLIIYDIHNIINSKAFFNNLKDIKIVATSIKNYDNNIFAVKISIPPLKTRKEDLEELVAIYKKEALKLYGLSHIKNNSKINIDLTKNNISLKQSIYKSIFLQSATTQDIIHILENYFYTQVQQNKTYKQLLSVFEIPLLKASKRAFKSQLKISHNLNINRMTLRKKLAYYFKEEL